MELPRNSGSSVWSGKCGWGISSDLFPLLSPLVGHVRAILLPRYTTKVVTRYRRHKAATPLGCTHSRYTIVVTHTVTHPQSSTSWTHEANMLAWVRPRPTPSTSLAWMLVVAGPACGDQGARRHDHLPRPGDSPPVLVLEPCRPSWTFLPEAD